MSISLSLSLAITCTSRSAFTNTVTVTVTIHVVVTGAVTCRRRCTPTVTNIDNPYCYQNCRRNYESSYSCCHCTIPVTVAVPVTCRTRCTATVCLSWWTAASVATMLQSLHTDRQALAKHIPWEPAGRWREQTKKTRGSRRGSLGEQ